MICIFAGSFLLAALAHAADQPTWSPDRGTWQYRLANSFTAGTNLVEVLLPDTFDRAKTYRVLYLLPVEAKENRRPGGKNQLQRATSSPPNSTPTPAAHISE